MSRIKTPPNVQEKWKRNAAEARALIEARQAEESRVVQKLRADLEREHNFPPGHPKLGLLWSLAWEYGHAYGANEIRSHYDDLAELLK